MIKYIKEEDKYVLDIPTLKEFRGAQNNFRKAETDEAEREKYFETIQFFLNWYIEYSSTILKDKFYDDKQIAECIFNPSGKSEAQIKEHLLKSVYISKEYVEYLKTKITKINVHVYNHALTELEIDLEELIANCEIYIFKSASNISLSSWRRRNLSPTDIYSAAKTLFLIEESPSIANLYLRDLKPAVMFHIRQLLEVFGRNILGYYEICDNNGNTIKKFTQIAWDFITEEIKQPSPRIQFPFHIHTILSIKNWSNGFVHTTYLHNSYIQFFALKAIKVIFVPSPKPIKIYTGKTTTKFDCSAITITNYNSLKTDFEKYLIKKQTNISVDWMKIEKVGAYVISV